MPAAAAAAAAATAVYADNQVSEVSGLAGNNPLLDTIELRANQLTSLKGLTDLPCLRKLCLVSYDNYVLCKSSNSRRTN